MIQIRVVDNFFFFSSRRRHTRFDCDWSSDVCSSDLQQTLDPGMCTPEMARLERALRAAGALGGKAAGAGAGGSMFFITGDDSAPGIAAPRAAGATVLPLRGAAGGGRAW